LPNDHAQATSRADVTAAALDGLSAAHKTLPPWLFYDALGCRLFYDITRLPEYYLTRTETALLQAMGPDLLPEGTRAAALVEFGGSDETKARHLLDLPGTPFATYVTIDVAEEALAEMRQRLAVSHPGLRVVTIAGDFLKPVALPDLEGPRLGFFPGSTIGNLDPEGAVRFLAAARRSLGEGAAFLLGADLRKSPDRLLPAYNDAQGVTAAFNLNLLARLNREAGADFDLDAFRHEALWNDAKSRIEMHLFSLSDQTATVAGVPIRFRAGESIHTENSYKHPQSTLRAIAAEAGWHVRREWTDPQGLFGIFLLD
jgi:hypothetical protein